MTPSHDRECAIELLPPERSERNCPRSVGLAQGRAFFFKTFEGPEQLSYGGKYDMITRRRTRDVKGTAGIDAHVAEPATSGNTSEGLAGPGISEAQSRAKAARPQARLNRRLWITNLAHRTWIRPARVRVGPWSFSGRLRQNASKYLQRLRMPIRKRSKHNQVK